MAQVGDEQDQVEGGEGGEAAPGPVDGLLQLQDDVLPALIQRRARRPKKCMRAQELAMFRLDLWIGN